MTQATHLRIYRFDPGAVFEGGLLAAVERMQVLGETKLLDALFVGRDPATGAVQAVDLRSAGAQTSFASLLDFRLDPARRQALTERTLAEHAGGVPRPIIEAVAATIDAGGAVLAVLHTGPSPAVLEEAVARCGGRSAITRPSMPGAVVRSSARSAPSSTCRVANRAGAARMTSSTSSATI